MPKRSNSNNKSNHRKKRPRSNNNKNTKKKKCYYDLMVPLPTSGGASERLLKLQHTLKRLETLGYHGVALTNTVFGAPKASDEDTAVAFPEIPSSKSSSLKILKRLHCVVENASDIGHFTTTDNRFAKNYDLVSLSPRNDAAFQAACATAKHVDIITLDYYNNNNHNIRIRPQDIKNAIRLGLTFEILYGPSVVLSNQNSNNNARKLLIQTARVFQTASIGCGSSTSKQKMLVLSSGATDFMTLRSSDDMKNVMEVVLGFPTDTSSGAMSVSCQGVLERARNRCGSSSSSSSRVVVAGVYIESERKPPAAISEEKKQKESDGTTTEVQVGSSNDEIVQDNAADEKDKGGEDGFISL